MKKLTILPVPFMITGFTVFLAVLFIALPAHAQMMGGWGNNQNSNNATNTATQDPDEQQGAQIYQRLQNHQTTCQELTNDDFDKLGDYFMGNMMGSAHDAADRAMTQRLGDQGEKQMHIAMGERLSGCNVNAAYPTGWNTSSWNGFLPMMMGLGSGFGDQHGMMGGNWDTAGFNNIMGAALLWILPAFVVVDLVLLTILLWKKVQSRR